MRKNGEEVWHNATGDLAALFSVCGPGPGSQFSPLIKFDGGNLIVRFPDGQADVKDKFAERRDVETARPGSEGVRTEILPAVYSAVKVSPDTLREGGGTEILPAV